MSQDRPPHQEIDIQEGSEAGAQEKRRARRGTKPPLVNLTLGEEPWQCDMPRTVEVKIKKGFDPWGTCVEKVREYDNGICEVWRDEIDKLLIFAGLFFSAVTAFVIESYKLLQEDPVERNTWLLEQLLIQGYNASVGLPPPSEPPVPPVFSASARDIRVNVFWFLSLSISLGTVFLGIVCLQWLREYQKNVPIDPQDAISIRQMRWEGLTHWKVPEILSSLPVLLNLSLTLFFAGLLDLLWSLDTAVAISSTIVVGLLVGFVVTTTILPSLQLFFIRDNSLQKPQCPYKSPQSWIVHRIVVRLIQWSRPSDRVMRLSTRLGRYKKFFDNKDWTATDIAWNQHRKTKPEAEDLVSGLAWIDLNLGQTVEMITSIAQCIQELLPNQSIRLLQKINSMFEAYFDDPKVNDSIRPKHEETPELLSALYLEKTKRSFPQFDTQHIESTIRVLNTQLAEASTQPTTQPNSPISAASQLIHHDHPLVFPFVKWPVISVHQLPTDVLHQLLACLTLLVKLRREGPYLTNIRDLALHGLEMVDQQRSIADHDDSVRKTRNLVLELVSVLRTYAFDEMVADKTAWERLQRLEHKLNNEKRIDSPTEEPWKIG